MEFHSGSSRLVLLIGGYAIKVPRLSGFKRIRQGMYCNLAERTAWAEQRYPNLCPLLWAANGGWVNIMVRASPMTFDEFDAWTNSDEWPHLHGVNTPYEYKEQDAGFLPDGRMVMIDYGVLGYR